MSVVRRQVIGIAALAIGAIAASAADARAQFIGVGARMVSVSGADSLALDPSISVDTKFAGGFLRLNASKHMTLEASMDYQSTTNAAEFVRIRNTPIQLSALVVPLRTALQPYFLAGIGWYKHKIEALDAGKAVRTVESTDFGYHTGVGGQLMMGKHAGLYVDYRYTWVDVNGIGGLPGAVRSAASLTSVLGLLGSSSGGKDSKSSDSSISRSGSMWTSGLAIYF